MPDNGISTRSSLGARVTVLLSTVGLMGSIFRVVLDHGYTLPAALYAAAVVGLTAATLTIWVLDWTTPTAPRGPWPSGLA